MIDFKNIDPVAFSIGDKLVIYKYALCLVFGMIAALITLVILNKRRGVNSDFIYIVFLWVIPLSVIFARVGYVIGRPEYSLNNFESIKQFFNIREGGLTIVTGILGGILGLAIACLRYKKSFFRVADLFVAPLLIGQAIGRWGNFFNQELFGKTISDPFLMRFPLGVKVAADGYTNWHYALFFYEGFLNALMACVFLIVIFVFIPCFKIDRKNGMTLSNVRYNMDVVTEDRLPVGVLSFMYIAWYALLRFMLEFLKDPLNGVHTTNGYKTIQLICFIVAPLALLLAILVWTKTIKLESYKMKLRHFELEDLLVSTNNNIVNMADVEEEVSINEKQHL